MNDDPIKAVYAMVERAHIRMQAGEVLMDCLETSDITPIRVLVEELVLAGPQSLGAVREIMAEVSQRRTQLEDDYNQVAAEFEVDLTSQGVQVKELRIRANLPRLEPDIFIHMLRQQGISDQSRQTNCLGMLRRSQDLAVNLQSHLLLLEELLGYLEDWMWGLVYQSARQELSSALITTTQSRYPH